MKYCVNCGAELYDDAVVCVKCGRSVAPNYNLGSNRRKNPAQNDGDFSIVSVFHFFTNVLCAISVFMIFLAFHHGGINSRYVYFYYNYTDALLAFIVSLAAFGMGFTTFILSLTKKQYGERLMSSTYTCAKTIILLLISFFVFVY